MLKLNLVSKSFDPSGQLEQLSETAGGALNFGVLTSAIISTARSPIGFDYFWAVDRGRRAIRPIRASALKIPIGGGKFIFRKYVGPSAPRYITQRGLSSLGLSATAAAQIARGANIIVWLKSFLNNLVDFQASAFKSVTPNGSSGRLASGYQVRKVQ